MSIDRNQVYRTLLEMHRKLHTVLYDQVRKDVLGVHGQFISEFTVVFGVNRTTSILYEKEGLGHMYIDPGHTMAVQSWPENHCDYSAYYRWCEQVEKRIDPLCRQLWEHLRTTHTNDEGLTLKQIQLLTIEVSRPK